MNAIMLRAMNDILPVAQYGLEVEQRANVGARGVGAALVAGGGLGLAMTPQEPGLKWAQRAVAGAASLATVLLGGVVATRPGLLMARARHQPRIFAGGFYTAAVVSTAGGGGHRSPAFFPAVLMTAVGAGVVGERRAGLVAGSAVAAGYLAGCARSLAPWERPLPRDAWWNLAAASAFVAAGQVGAIAGDLSLLSRSLSDYVARELEAREAGGGRERMEADASIVREAAEQHLMLLPEVEKAFQDDPAVLEATGEMSTALATLRNAQVRLAIAEAIEDLDLVPQLQRFVDNHNVGSGNARVHLHVGAGVSRTSASTAAAIINAMTALVQNSANARRPGADPVRVEVTLGVVHERGARELELVVEDDAGAEEIPTVWGTGLSDSELAARNLGGRFRLELGRAGLRAVLTLPYIKGRTHGSEPLTLSGQFADGRDRALRDLRHATALQGLFTLLSVTPPDELLPRLARLGALLAVGEIAERLPDRSRAVVEAALAPIAMSAFFGPARPPMGGWAAVMSASPAARHDWRLGVAAGVLATVGATVVAGPERFGRALPVTIGDRTFALIGMVGGAGVRWGLGRLARDEARVGHAAWLAVLLEDLVAPGRDPHHFTGPLEHALGPERWGQFRRTSLGERIMNFPGSAARDAQRRLEEQLRLGDPLRILQHQVARLLADAPVHVEGKRPPVTIPGRGREIEIISYRVGLISVGQAIARRARGQLPSYLAGGARLQRIHLQLTPGETKTQIDVLPVPFEARQSDRLDAILDAAARRAGGSGAGELPDRFRLTVHNASLG